jgi:serine/threonine protein kinase
VRASPNIPTPLPRATVCGYTVLRSPSPGSYVALGDAGREIFLKPLDPDCLLHGQLHPSIKERLARVRELALKSAANLHGVERDGSREENGAVFLVWEFVPGEPLETRAQLLAAPQLLPLLRQIVLSVEALHQVGIVHGALHARNIIIDLAGRPRLTHISPLLFHDPAADEAALSQILKTLIAQRDDMDSSTSTAVEGANSLRQMAASMVAADVLSARSDPVDNDDRHRRRRLLIIAFIVATAGAALAVTAGILGSRL